VHICISPGWRRHHEEGDSPPEIPASSSRSRCKQRARVGPMLPSGVMVSEKIQLEIEAEAVLKS
jgi:hypothetical protein